MNNSSQKPPNPTGWAAIGAGGGTVVLTVITALGGQPWWVTVSITVALTVIAVTWMVTRTWQDRPPTLHLPPPPYTLPDDTSSPYSVTYSQSPPPRRSDPPDQASLIERPYPREE